MWLPVLLFGLFGAASRFLLGGGLFHAAAICPLVGSLIFSVALTICLQDEDEWVGLAYSLYAIMDGAYGYVNAVRRRQQYSVHVLIPVQGAVVLGLIARFFIAEQTGYVVLMLVVGAMKLIDYYLHQFTVINS